MLCALTVSLVNTIVVQIVSVSVIIHRHDPAEYDMPPEEMKDYPHIHMNKLEVAMTRWIPLYPGQPGEPKPKDKVQG